jgi:predicted nucleic acid-binding protein
MTVLIDSSAWIEHWRRDSAPSLSMERVLRARQAATTDQVLMELLAGTNAANHLARAQSALNGCEFLQQRTYVDASAAAAIYRLCRQKGETPRNLSDCLIAAVAMRNDVDVLHNDRDYDVIARHTGLRVVRT